MKKINWPVVGGIVAAVAAVWYFLRNGAAGPAVQYQPSPASSGVPAYLPAVQQYKVQAPTIGPSPLVLLGNASNPYPNGQIDDLRASAPSLYGNDYLIYNQPPSADLSKTMRSYPEKKHGGCGDCGGCKDSCPDNNAQFTDGQGNGCMVTTRGKQLADLENNYPGLWEKLAEQVAASGMDSEDFTIHATMQLQDAQKHTPPARPVSWKSALIPA